MTNGTTNAENYRKLMGKKIAFRVADTRFPDTYKYEYYIIKNYSRDTNRFGLYVCETGGYTLIEAYQLIRRGYIVQRTTMEQSLFNENFTRNTV